MLPAYNHFHVLTLISDLKKLENKKYSLIAKKVIDFNENNLFNNSRSDRFNKFRNSFLNGF